METVIHEVLGFGRESRLGSVMAYFVEDSVKILLLLAVMIFVIGVGRSYLPEEKLRAWMERGGILGNLVAAMFGALTPFCSCSSIPIFIGLLRARAPLGVAFSFLITSPLVNEYLVILMVGKFGASITAVYVGSGLVIGTLGGALIGWLKLERYLEADLTRSIRLSAKTTRPRFGDRLRAGWVEVSDVLRRIWLWILVAVAIGAVIHNVVPEETVHRAVETTGVFGVPIATLLGVPLYGSCAAIVPVAVVLFGKGVPLGTTLAFMMAMAALSLPEAVMLRRVMRLPLVAWFFGLVTLAIVVTGYLVNAFELLR